MGIHYDKNAGYNSARKTLTSNARYIIAEEKEGVNQKNFKNRFVQDNDHSMSFFKKACKMIGNLTNKEIEEMLDILKQGTPHQYGEVYHFDEEKMYQVLISNPICRKVCEKQGYNNWADIIARCR